MTLSLCHRSLWRAEAVCSLVLVPCCPSRAWHMVDAQFSGKKLIQGGLADAPWEFVGENVDCLHCTWPEFAIQFNTLTLPQLSMAPKLQLRPSPSPESQLKAPPWSLSAHLFYRQKSACLPPCEFTNMIYIINRKIRKLSIWSVIKLHCLEYRM